MEGEVDDGHFDLDLDQVDEPRVHKKLKKVDNPDDDESHDEGMEIEDQNPFHIQIILDALFKMLSFEDVKKFRFVSSTWNEVGSSELSRRHQKPIKFRSIEELGLDDKLGELIQLQKNHDLIFPTYNHQLFSKFSINISQLSRANDQATISIFDIFFEFFTPSFVHIYGSPSYHPGQEPTKKEEILALAYFLCKFLVKISSTVQEIDFDAYDIQSFNDKERFVELSILEELTRTKFPHLRKISNNIYTISNLQRMFFYPIIGQNSPKLRHLLLGSRSFYWGKEILDEELKPKLESSGLLPKLRILDLLDVNSELLDLITEFGQLGLFKLTKLNFKTSWSVNGQNSFVRLIASQGDSLKILKISTPFQMHCPYNTIPIRETFPTLQNITSLQIDHFSSFQKIFEPFNFSLLFPKLEEFRTFDIEHFLKYPDDDDEDLGEGGYESSVKFVSFLSRRPRNFDEEYLDITLVYKVFPNLEFLELDSGYLPLEGEGEENISFWSRLSKLRINCSKLDELYVFDTLVVDFLKVVKKIEIVMECENTLALEDSYKNSISDLFRHSVEEDMDHFSRDKLYQKFLKKISKHFSPIFHLTSISIIGHKISENFKRDFRAIFPDCNFVCCKYKAAKNY